MHLTYLNKFPTRGERDRPALSNERREQCAQILEDQLDALPTVARRICDELFLVMTESESLSRLSADQRNDKA